MTFQEQSVELAGGTVSYHVAGEGRPVLYLHPAGGFRASAPLESLAENFRVYAPVTPGFDGTPFIDGVDSMEGLAGLMGSFVDSVIAGNCDIVGHSFGGWLATWCAVLMPDKIGQLVLECPAGFRAEGAGGLSNDPEEMRRLLFAHPEKAPTDSKPPEILKANRAATVHYHGGKAMDEALAARLGEIEMWTLILHGTKDRAIPIESPRLLKSRMPHAFLIYVYDAAHAIEVDQPELVGNVVKDFLTRGEAFLVNQGTEEPVV